MNEKNAEAILEDIKKDVDHLRKDIDYIKALLLPEEDITDEEMKELDQIEREMSTGKKIKFED